MWRGVNLLFVAAIAAVIAVVLLANVIRIVRRRARLNAKLRETEEALRRLERERSGP
jgi:hypothetical protein